jgi:hypothetical protein
LKKKKINCKVSLFTIVDPDPGAGGVGEGAVTLHHLLNTRHLTKLKKQKN